MKTKIILLICAVNLLQLSYASDPYYYEKISNPTKTIDYLFGFYTKNYSIGKASDDKEYVIYSAAIMNSSTSTLTWDDYHVIVRKKDGDLIFSYKTAATSGDYASNFTVNPNGTHTYWVAFHDVFKPEDIAEVHLLNKSILKSYILVKSEEKDEPVQSYSSNKDLNSNVQNCSLFPLYGITLGKTTVQELSSMGTRSVNIDKSTNEPYKYYKVNDLKFWFDNSLADHMYITYTDALPLQWKDCGFDWSLSYNEWKGMLENRGFNVSITKSPVSKLYDGRQTLSAEITALKKITSDITVNFRFDFDYGKSASVDAKETLYSISIFKE